MHQLVISPNPDKACRVSAHGVGVIRGPGYTGTAIVNCFDLCGRPQLFAGTEHVLAVDLSGVAEDHRSVYIGRRSWAFLVFAPLGTETNSPACSALDNREQLNETNSLSGVTFVTNRYRHGSFMRFQAESNFFFLKCSSWPFFVSHFSPCLGWEKERWYMDTINRFMRCGTGEIETDSGLLFASSAATMLIQVHRCLLASKTIVVANEFSLLGVNYGE